MLVLDGRGSPRAVQLARTLRALGLSRSYVVQVCAVFICAVAAAVPAELTRRSRLCCLKAPQRVCGT